MMGAPEGWFAAASVASAVTFCVHTFIGGARVARPLLADEGLPRASKWLNYYCWHIVTVFLAAMSAGFGFLAMRPDAKELAIYLAINVAMFSPLSAFVALSGGIAPFRFPSTSLFLIIALLGAAGLVARWRLFHDD